MTPPRQPRCFSLSRERGSGLAAAFAGFAEAVRGPGDLKIQEDAKRSPVAVVRDVAFVVKGGVEAPVHAHPLAPVGGIVMDDKVEQGSLRSNQFVTFAPDLCAEGEEMFFVMAL